MYMIHEAGLEGALVSEPTSTSPTSGSDVSCSCTGEAYVNTATASDASGEGDAADLRAPEPNEDEVDIERFRQRSQLLSLALDDPRAARAIELKELDDHRSADRILKCGNMTGFLKNRTCHRRDCPVCAEKIAWRNKIKIERAISSMTAPYLFLVSMRSKGSHDLAATVSEFRSSLGVLRRRKFFRAAVRAGVGAIETKVASDNEAWTVHAHVVLDADIDQLDLERTARMWKEFTRGLGTFAIDPSHPSVEQKNVARLATYIAKSDTWSPMPGSMEPERLDLIRSAIKGRRLLVQWGPDR
jgi:hypothetical protein